MSNNCYDLRESIADTPKRSIISINEFLFSFSALGRKFSKRRNRKSAKFSSSCVWRVLIVIGLEVNKLVPLPLIPSAFARFTVSIKILLIWMSAEIGVLIFRNLAAFTGRNWRSIFVSANDWQTPMPSISRLHWSFNFTRIFRDIFLSVFVIFYLRFFTSLHSLEKNDTNSFADKHDAATKQQSSDFSN